MKKLLLLSALLLVSFVADAQHKGNKYFGLYKNYRTGSEYYSIADVEPLYSIRDFVGNTLKPEFTVKCLGVVFYNENGKIAKFLYAGELAGIEGRDQVFTESFAKFIKGHPMMFAENLQLGYYSGNVFELDVKSFNKLIEIKEDIIKLMDAYKAPEDKTFVSPESGHFIPKNLYLSILSTHILFKINSIEEAVMELCDFYKLSYEEVIGFIDDLSNSLGYIEQGLVDEGFKRLSLLIAKDVKKDSFEVWEIPSKEFIDKLLQEKLERRKSSQTKKKPAKSRKFNPKPIVREKPVYQEEKVVTEEIKSIVRDRIFRYYTKNAPHLKSSLYGKGFESLIKFAIISNIPNMEKRNFRISPDLTELLFGTQQEGWSDGVIAMTRAMKRERVHPALLEMLALRLMCNGASQIWMYDSPTRTTVTSIPFEEFMGKEGVSQKIIIKSAEDAVPNNSSARELNMYRRTSDRLVNIKNGFWPSTEYKIVPNDNKAVSLMRVYSGLESDDFFEQLQEVLKVMADNINDGVYFGEKELKLWFEENLYEYLLGFNETLEVTHPQKEDVEFAILAVSSLVFYSHSSELSKPIVTRSALMKVIHAKNDLEFGNDHFMQVFNGRINDVNLPGVKQFPALLSKGYYGLIKY